MREEIPTPADSNGHPGVETWIAYHGGELAERETERLQRHLVACPACVSLVLDLDAFAAEPAEADRASVSEFELAAAWKSMKASLPDRLSPPRWFERRVRVPMALAASLVAGAVGLSLWGIEHRRAEAYTRPQVNLAIRDLEPNQATRSGGSPSPAEVRRDSYAALVMLPSRTFDTYQVEIIDARGHRVWSGSGLVAHPELGTLSLGLPPGFLDPGEYVVKLYGGEEKIPLEDDLPIRVIP